MEILYLMIPLAVLIVMLIALGFFWAVKSGQFDDLEGPAYSILMDEDELDVVRKQREEKEAEAEAEAKSKTQSDDPPEENR